MDTNYVLGREQTSLYNADQAVHPDARAAHAGLAEAYGAVLAESAFPHRQFTSRRSQGLLDGGHVVCETAPAASTVGDEQEITALECDERRLAKEYSDGKVSLKAFQTRSRFLRQRRVAIETMPRSIILRSTSTATGQADAVAIQAESINA